MKILRKNHSNIYSLPPVKAHKLWNKLIKIAARTEVKIKVHHD